MKTRILKVPQDRPQGHFAPPTTLETWHPPAHPPAALLEAAALLRTSSVPVAFPTETVYGLGADATRPAAVAGIYAAKRRPADNPLIVHVADLAMLRALLPPDCHDDIPAIYLPLLQRFWPGPLTILLPVCADKLAPAVTAGLRTFGARMPAGALARDLIALAGRPLAAPSANASTRPSPTAAAHVVEDLDGRIEVVLDGGACAVGVESTVVDGLSVPPAVLRPGGVGLEELRRVRGWEGTVRAYRDEGEGGVPRAPGMKYKHYSPRARVVLYEQGERVDVLGEVRGLRGGDGGGVAVVGVIRTKGWERIAGGEEVRREEASVEEEDGAADLGYEISTTVVDGSIRVLDIGLGRETRTVAQGLFSALRELDRRGAHVILVEGVEDGHDLAAAVMNRLRKAASEIRA